MKNVYVSRRCLPLLTAALLTGTSLIHPIHVFAGNNTGKEDVRKNFEVVTGIVTDAASGKALEGATVAVKGSTVSTFTSSNGSFSINVPGNNSTLVISYVGYVSREVAVGNNRA